MNLEILVGVAVAVGVLVALFIATYKVVEPNQAHVVVFMGRGRKIYAPLETKDGKRHKSAYFFVPLLMKRFVLPLTNVKMAINDIHLNDKMVAPFICDVIAWVRVLDPILAAERLDLTHQLGVFGSLHEDLVNIVQAIARAVAMKQEVLDIMRDRQTFANSMSNEVNGLMGKWGVELVNLEVNDIRDDGQKGSEVIANYESMRKVQVNAAARKEIAERDREATVAEQENRQKSEIATAEAEENFTKRQIEKDKQIGITQQAKEMAIAEETEKANAQKVRAARTFTVGSAEVERDATIQKANGEAEAIRIKGEKQANVVKLTGEAEGAAIQARGFAEAAAKDKMAEALKKFNESGTVIEKIRAWIEVQKAMWQAHAMVAQNAQIKIVNSGKGGSILGFPLNAETGADLGQMVEGMGGIDKAIAAIGNLMPKPGDKK